MRFPEHKNLPAPGGVRHRLLSASLFFSFPVALVVVGTLLIANNTVNQSSERTAPPLLVHSARLERQSRFSVLERLVGQVEPQRHTELGFESSGTLAELYVEEGDSVVKGDLLARLNIQTLVTQYDEQIAVRDALLAQLELAELTDERQHDLIRRNLTPRQQYDEARLKTVELSARVSQVDAVLSGIDVALQKSGIFAPFSGDIGAIFVDEGTRVFSGTPVVSLLERSHPRVRIGVPRAVAKSLDVSANYIIDIRGTRFKAKLHSIRQDLDPTTRTLAAIFRVTFNSDRGAPFGDVGELLLNRQINQSGAWVPLSALAEGSRGLWSLYLIDDSGDHDLVQRESVVVIYADEHRAFVRGAFADGVRYITDGNHRVAVGQHVRYLRAER